jgi:hypothetical protein
MPSLQNRHRDFSVSFRYRFLVIHILLYAVVSYNMVTNVTICNFIDLL